MAIIRDGKNIDYSLIGRDQYLRSQDAPAFSDDTVSYKDIRGGAEMVSRSGNIMPRAISRDKLADDALLFNMNLNVNSEIVIHVATGYDKSLNNYIYAVTWDGTDYYIRRFNTMNLLSPYQDGYAVNIPAGVSINAVLGLTVLDDKVGVMLDTAQGTKIYFYDFDLSYLSVLAVSPFTFEDGLNYRNLLYDSKHIIQSVPSSTRFSVVQAVADSSSMVNTNNDGNQVLRQRFKTVSNGGNITKIGFYMGGSGLTPNATRWYDLLLLDVNDNLLQTATINEVFASDSPFTWHFKAVDWAVSGNTVYKLAPRGQAPSSEFSPRVGYKNSNVYTDGYMIVAGPDIGETNKDMAFKVYQKVPNDWAGKILRFNPADMSLVDSLAWPAGYVQPTELLAYDKKFYYGYNLATKTITKFAIVDSNIVVASEQIIQEDVRGVLFFNSFVFITYVLGGSVVGVPVSL